jgi:hypothetical protein
MSIGHQFPQTTPPTFAETINGPPAPTLISRSFNPKMIHDLFQCLFGHGGIREQPDLLVATRDGDYGRFHFSIHRRLPFFHLFVRYQRGISQVVPSQARAEYGCLILLFPVRHPCQAFQETHLCPPVFLCSMDTVFPMAAMHENMKNRAQEKERPRQDVQNICLVFLQEEQGGARHEP